MTIAFLQQLEFFAITISKQQNVSSSLLLQFKMFLQVCFYSSKCFNVYRSTFLLRFNLIYFSNLHLFCPESGDFLALLRHDGVIAAFY